MAHQSVLLKEVIDGLDLEEGDVYLDATVGSGGHIEEVWKRTKGTVSLSGIDVDEVSISITKERLDLVGAKAKLSVINFRNIDKVPDELGLGQPSKIIFDLGWSSDQVETSEEEGGRGFSFLRDEPLIMTLKSSVTESDTTAYDVVNKWSEENLKQIILGYGEEKFANRIAEAIVREREQKEIKTSKELSEIVKRAVPVFYRFGRIHPATRTFQAIRIAVNDELSALSEGLTKGFEILKEEGRMAVISFHSLEDRIVKNFFREKKEEGRAEILTKKPITPTEEEIEKNRKSRSAKLRIIKKIKNAKPD